MPLAPIASTPFDEVELDRQMSRDATFGPAYKTTVIAKGAGGEQRNSEWNYPLHDGEIAFEQRRPEMAQSLQSFFVDRVGQTRGFRYYDVLDHDTIDKMTGLNVPQPLAAIPGNPGVYQLQKVYDDGVRQQARKISKPISDVLGDTAATATTSTIRVYQDGSAIPFTCDCTTGLVTLGGGGGGGGGSPNVHTYSLNETSGTIAHDTSGGVNGTISGSVSLGQPGHGGGGTSFLFSGGQVSVGDLLVPSGLNEWHVSCDFNALVSSGTLLSWGNYSLYLEAGTHNLIIDTGSALLTLAIVSLGVWHTITVSYVPPTYIAFGYDGLAFDNAHLGVAATGSNATFGNGPHGAFSGSLQNISFSPTNPTATSAPGLTATFAFDVPCRFSTDLQQIEEGTGAFYHWSRIGIEEIRIPTGLLINP